MQKPPGQSAFVVHVGREEQSGLKLYARHLPCPVESGWQFPQLPWHKESELHWEGLSQREPGSGGEQAPAEQVSPLGHCKQRHISFYIYEPTSKASTYSISASSTIIRVCLNVGTVWCWTHCQASWADCCSSSGSGSHSRSRSCGRRLCNSSTGASAAICCRWLTKRCGIGWNRAWTDGYLPGSKSIISLRDNHCWRQSCSWCCGNGSCPVSLFS